MSDADSPDTIGASAMRLLGDVWIPAGVPGFSGADKSRRKDVLDGRFGADGWRFAHVVRGSIVPPEVAILEYEESYRRYLRARHALVDFIVGWCGNVYDWDVSNVYDNDYAQPGTAMNHYQDISVRRVIAELVDDTGWPSVTATDQEIVDLVDSRTGACHHVPRARGMRGSLLLQIRDPESAGYMLSPAVVPAWDPALLSAAPGHLEWYHSEGCAHLSVEAFWQSGKVVIVRYDRFLVLGSGRASALEGL
ncbi:MAG TPA: hypothetical protein VMX33_06880 [bacterium]|nr:hypothetical protein [bacterium]